MKKNNNQLIKAFLFVSLLWIGGTTCNVFAQFNEDNGLGGNYEFNSDNVGSSYSFSDFDSQGNEISTSSEIGSVPSFNDILSYYREYLRYNQGNKKYFATPFDEYKYKSLEMLCVSGCCYFGSAVLLVSGLCQNSKDNNYYFGSGIALAAAVSFNIIGIKYWHKAKEYQINIKSNGISLTF